MNYEIFTDVSVDIDMAFADAHNVHYIAMNYLLGTEETRGVVGFKQLHKTLESLAVTTFFIDGIQLTVSFDGQDRFQLQGGTHQSCRCRDTSSAD